MGRTLTYGANLHYTLQARESFTLTLIMFNTSNSGRMCFDLTEFDLPYTVGAYNLRPAGLFLLPLLLGSCELTDKTFHYIVSSLL